MILKTQLIELLKKGGFKLHKRASNKQDLRCDSHNTENTQIISLEASSVRKLLGIH